MSRTTTPGTKPDPEDAADLAAYIDLLGQLRTWAGAPSIRNLAKQVGPLMRPPRMVSHSTVGEVFQTRRRRLDLDLVLAIVRALDPDDAAVERWRAVYLRVHRDTKTGGPTGVLRQLPVDLATFIGREKELAVLTGAADAAGENQRTVVISAVEGMAGVGKTQLALHAAHRLVRAGRYADLQLYANLRGFDPDHEPSDPAAVLEVFLRQLEVPAAHVPAGLDERSAMFRDRMYGRRALLLLDNAADDGQLRPLLPASPTCMVIITSRRSLAALEGASTVTLDVLDPPESIELLTRIVGAERVATEPEAAAKLVDLCGGLPLAVSLTAARLRSRPVWTLQYLVDRLSTGLDEITAGSRGLARVFDLSYQGLPKAAQHVFRLLGVHPAMDFTAPSIAALAGMDLGEAEQILELLQDERLVQQKVLDRYELHDLLRVYAAERAKAETTEEERSQAVAAVLDWYVATGAAAALVTNPEPTPFPSIDERGVSIRFRDPKQALAWYDRERPNLLRILEAAANRGGDRTAMSLSLVMTTFEGFVRNWRETERLLRTGVFHARRCAAPEAEAQLLYRLGFTLFQDNRSAEAFGPLREALALARKNHDLLNEQRALNALALAHTASGDHELGLEVALQSLSLRNDNAEVRLAPRSINVFTTVATCMHDLGRPEEALPYILASIEEARAQDDQLVIAASEHNLGFTYLVLERHAEAIPAFEASIAIARGMGSRYIEADSLNGIALAMDALGRTPEAQEYHRRALAVFDDVPEAEAVRLRTQLDTSPLRYPPAEENRP